MTLRRRGLGSRRYSELTQKILTGFRFNRSGNRATFSIRCVLLRRFGVSQKTCAACYCCLRIPAINGVPPHRMTNSQFVNLRPLAILP
jgi:hypothetical protein